MTDYSCFTVFVKKNKKQKKNRLHLFSLAFDHFRDKWINILYANVLKCGTILNSTVLCLF